jgi:hypothetical protein
MRTRFALLQAVCVFIIGASIGWLAGLSLSPVIATILNSVLSVGTGLVVGLHSLSSQNTDDRAVGHDVDVRPVALFTLGIAVAASLGIVARTHSLFGPPSSDLQVTHIQPGASDVRERQLAGGLFASQGERCADLRAKADFPNPDAFRDALRDLGTDGNALVDKVPDVAVLRLAVRALCSEK